MPAGEGVDPGRLELAQPPQPKELECLRLAEAAHLDALHQRGPAGRGQPAGGRWVAAGDDGDDAVGEGGQELLAHPGVEEAEGLVVVQHQHGASRLAAQAPGDRVEARRVAAAAQGRPDRGEEPPRGGLDLPAVQPQHPHAGRGAAQRLVHQAGLADPARPVDERQDDRAVGADGSVEGLQLPPAADERPGGGLGDAVGDAVGHGPRSETPEPSSRYGTAAAGARRRPVVPARRDAPVAQESPPRRPTQEATPREGTDGGCQ